MKNFKCFKGLFCLVFTLVFAFAGVSFVQASSIEGKEVARLTARYEYNHAIIHFVGSVVYTCSNPYQDKKILSVENISLQLEDYWDEDFDFEQQQLESVNISYNGRTIHALVCGRLIEHQGDFDYIHYIKVPVVYSINS